MGFSDYAKSFMPTYWCICGVELLPLTLGHYILMRNCNVGFATDEESTMVGWDDLVVSLLICSMTYEQFVDLLNNKKDGKKVRLWYAPWKYDDHYCLRMLKRLGKKLEQRVKREKLDINGIKEKIKLFQTYLQENTKTPDYWEGESEHTSETGAHWSQNLFTTAISKLNYTRTEALNTPLTQLFNDFFKYAESQGSLTLMNEDEEKQIKNANTQFIEEI